MIGPLAPRAAEDGPLSAAAEETSPWRERLARRLRGMTRRQMIAVALGALAILALVLGGGGLDLEAFHAWTRRIPAVAVAALIGVLPLAGFPISALHLAAGLRFEFWAALAIVAAATLAQHAAAWALVRALPERFFTRLRPWRKKLAGAGHTQAAVLCCLLPGMPYTVQLYLLPLMGAPLRVLCRVSVPLHTARATVTILLGNVSDDLTPGRVTALVAYYAAVFTVCAFVLKRLRRSLSAADSEETGEAR